MRPVSLALVPHQPRRGKALLWVVTILALGMFACCGSVVFIAMKGRQQQEAALAEADKLYPTKPAQAVARYKEGYPAAGDRRAEVLQRIVDFEAEAGNTAEAAKWVERGLDDKLAVSYTSAAAKDLHARVQRDRAEKEAAKKEEAEARAKQREEGKASRNQARDNRSLPRDQFRALVSGRTEQQVLEALGKPDETQDIEGTGKMWYYRNAAVDPTTGKRSALVQVVFEGGTVTMVNFN